MAQRTQLVLTDDIDGSAAEETIRFGLDGTHYEIDLNSQHAGQFRKAVQPYADAARKAAAPARRGGRAASRRGNPDPSEVRAWAKAEGLTVNDRGRVPEELIVKFRAAGQ